MSVPVGPLEVISSLKKAQRFVLNRKDDPTGISGTGIVAWGILWPDGTASLRWNTRYRSSVTYEQGMEAVKAIHGHEGSTEIVFIDKGD
jgi:lipoprotein-anchoring transpeptidase ErfK/SrfK